MNELQTVERLDALRQLIVSNYGTLVQAAYDAYPGLMYNLPEAIISQLSVSLESYDGPVELEPFMAWAVERVWKEAERHRFTMMVFNEYANVIHAAIHKYRWTSYKDCAVSHDDLFMEIMERVFKKAHKLSQRGTAKLSTRLTALARKHIHLYHNKKSYRRLKLVTKKIDRIPDSIRLSDEEIASMQADDEIYDPGYAECALN